MDLLSATVDLLRATTLTREEIAKGAAVSVRWLNKLKAGELPDPSVRRTTRLYRFLAAHAKLESPCPFCGGRILKH